MPELEFSNTTVGIIAFGPVASQATGYHVRTHHIAELLSGICDEVIVFEFTESVETDGSSGHYTSVRLECEDEQTDEESGILEEYLTFDALDAIRFQIDSVSALCDAKSHLAECDVILIGGALIPAGIVVSKLTGTRTVLDTHCINKRLAEGYRERNFTAYVARRTLWDALERFATNASDEVISVCEEEAQFVSEEYGVDSSHVFEIQNVVELPDMEYNPAIVRALERDLDLEGRRVATFVGALDSVQNRDAVEFLIDEIAPAVRQADHDIVFLVIGRGYEQWTESPENIHFTGFVDDLTPYMALSDVCIAPLRIGTGTKTKILEYMAYDKPVLTTETGAEGLPIDDLTGVAVTSPESFAEHLLDFDAVFGDYDGGNRAFVSDNYTPTSIRDNLCELVGVGDDGTEQGESEHA